MHKGYAYQNFNSCYFLKLQEYNLITIKNKNNMNLNSSNLKTKHKQHQTKSSKSVTTKINDKIQGA